MPRQGSEESETSPEYKLQKQEAPLLDLTWILLRLCRVHTIPRRSDGLGGRLGEEAARGVVNEM